LPKRIQEGIFYDRISDFKKYGNHSFAILFLRVVEGYNAQQVYYALDKIWHLYDLLKKGILTDVPNCRVPPGGMSVLIGFGPKIFNIQQIRKKIPRDFEGKQFLSAISEKPILKGSGIKYSTCCENVGTSEHVAIQFISETQLSTYRAIVETWCHLHGGDKELECLRLTKFYTGFQRDDGRSWLGFHDELSNMKDVKERKYAISINRDSNKLKPDDFWAENGTYMTFLRTEIDLDIWRRTGRKEQELIVGRDKISGSPIIGIDRNNNPIVVENYQRPIPGERYDPKFHDHPDYFRSSSLSDMINVQDTERSRDILSQSHIGRVRHISKVSSKDPTSRRIYRQGFEFVEYLYNEKKPFRIGQNFISFQNDPNRLFFILTDPRWMGKANFGGSPDLFGKNLLSILSAGMFFVPAKEKPFPGASIFR
jgi:deferrochelatase/peroxidase EfeB